MGIGSGRNFYGRCRAILIVLAAAVLARPALAADTEDYALWAHRAKISFNTTATGSNVSGPVKNFPLLVRLTGHADILNEALATGGDIRFADADGTHLPFQIERWDHSAGKAEVWVRVPQIDGNSDQDYITMYWGKPDAPYLSDGSKVFYSGDGYLGVWHLGEGGQQMRANSVGTGNHATPMNYGTIGTSEGVVGLADNFNGGSYSYRGGSTPGNYLDLGAGFSDFTKGITLSCWANFTGDGSWGRLFDLGNGEGIDNIIFARQLTNPTLSIQPFAGTATGAPVLAANSITDNVWANFAVTILGLDAIIYKNGVKVASGKVAVTVPNILRTNNYIGRSNWAVDAYFKGLMDEPEIANVVRSPDYLKLAYESQRDGANLASISAIADTKLSVTNQPLSQTVREGFAATFTVTAISGHHISYQWFKNGGTLSGATDSTYAIPIVAVADTGTYVCRMADGVDTLQSAPATLTLSENYGLWTHSMKIGCNTTSSGASVSGNVANFPMLIRLTAAIFDFTQAADKGDDVRFSDSAGTPLAYQIERWDASAKEADIWVRIPQVKGNSNAYGLNMFWGRAGAAAASSSSDVFRSADGFKGVWHLEESGGGDALDAVSNQLNGKGVRTSGGAAGVIGSAFLFEGTVPGTTGGTSYIGLPAAMTAGLNAFTFSLWAKEMVTDTGTFFYTAPTLLGIGTGGEGSSDFGVVSKGGRLGVWEGLNAALDTMAVTSVDLHDGQWHHVAVTYNGSAVSLYEAGTKLKDLPATNKSLATLAFSLGAVNLNGTHAYGFNGYLDDFQISGVPRSADWIRLAYESQRPGGKALAFSAVAFTPVPTPTADPPAGSYAAALAVKLTCPVEGARVFYTLDGSVPDTLKSQTFAAGAASIPLAKSTVITAVAFKGSVASQVLTAAYVVNLTPSAKGDSLIPGRALNLDATHWIRFPLQESKAPVLVVGGIPWNALPAGFDSVGARFRVEATDTGAAFPGLQVMLLDSTSKVSLYRMEAGAIFRWQPPLDGLLWITAPGTYFWALDTALPRMHYVHASLVGADSLRIRFVLEDNVVNLRGRLLVWNDGADTLDWYDGNAGDTMSFTVAAPTHAKVPLEISFTLSDNVRSGVFPKIAPRYTVGRLQPAFSAEAALDSGIVWKLVGLPVFSPTPPLAVGGLGGTPGDLVAAVWDKVSGDSGSYRILRDADTLPRGQGFWIASRTGVKTLNLPPLRSFSSDSDGFFSIHLANGWNLVTCPSFRPLVWPASRKDGDAYLTSTFKGLRSWDGSEYNLADTLKPFEGYYVYNHGGDTIIHVGPGAPGVAKSAAKLSAVKASASRNGSASQKASAGNGGGGLVSLCLGTGRGEPLELGAASFAGDGIGREDELSPPTRGERGTWLARAGRSLTTDYISSATGQALRWTLVAQGKPPGYRIEALSAVLPADRQAWAVSASRRMKYRLDGGGGIPVTGTDTLAIYIGTALQLSALPDWNLSRVSPPDLKYSLSNAGGGLELILFLPSPARVEIRVWSPQGRRLGHLEAGEVGEGRHGWNWSAISGHGNAGPGNRPPAGICLVELSIQGRGWQFHHTEKWGPSR